MLTFARLWFTITSPEPSSAAMGSVISRAVCQSWCATVNVMSVSFSTLAFCTIVSTEMPASASGPKICAAMPGRSSTARTVSAAMSLSSAIPRTRSVGSMMTCSRISVPGVSSWKDDATKIGMSWISPSSTARGCITAAPCAASSSISS